MKVLYGARMARADLLKCVCSLASRVNHWGSAVTERLHRLMCYIAQSKAVSYTHLRAHETSAHL
eukprot:15371511-Alexandrium_andersonii.AAC.1